MVDAAWSLKPSVVPLCISALEHYEDEITPFKALFRYKLELSEARQTLFVVHTSFKKTIINLCQDAGVADCQQLERMIEATLSYLRGDRSGEAVQAVELVALVGTIADDATDMGQQVSVSTPASLVVHGRRLALKRALTNLVQNAVKYGGGAEVELLSQPDHAAIAIRDRGPGIPAEKIVDLFEPFVRLDESRNSVTGGVGLGLTIARDIVSAHGGQLILRNRNDGGLEAIVELPTTPASRNIS